MAGLGWDTEYGTTLAPTQDPVLHNRGYLWLQPPTFTHYLPNETRVDDSIYISSTTKARRDPMPT